MLSNQHVIKDKAPQTFKIRFLIPQTYNDGAPIDRPILEFFEEIVLIIAGGWTDFGTSRGGFTFPDGRFKIDLNTAYEVTGSSRVHVDQIRRALHAFGRLAGQHSVYFEVDTNTQVHIEEVAPPSPEHLNGDGKHVLTNTNALSQL